MQQVTSKAGLPIRWSGASVQAWLTLDMVWVLLLPATLLIALNTSTVEPNDFWWHVRTGQLMVTEHRIPFADEFSFTRAGAPWTNQAWLMQTFLYLLYTLGGLPLVIAVHALTVTAGYVAVTRSAVRVAGLRAGVLAGYLGAAVGMWGWGVRPQSLSFLLFGLLLALMASHRRGHRRRLWWALPLFLIWGNGHGGFVFGLAALGLYILGCLWTMGGKGWLLRESAARELVAVGGGALLVLSLNPQGPLGLVQYIAGFLRSDATLASNGEFLPITIRSTTGVLFFASLLLFVFLYQKSGARLGKDQVFTVLCFAALTLFSRRSAPWYGLVLIAPLAQTLHPYLSKGSNRKEHPALNGTVSLLLVAGVLLSLPWFRASLPALETRKPLLSAMTPVQAVDFLCAHTSATSARIYQDQAFASYQIWACPQLPVFIDTRIELYPLAQWDDYAAISGARFDWEEIAARYGITHLLLSTVQQQDLIRAAASAPGWRLLYRDERAVIFVRVHLSRPEYY